MKSSMTKKLILFTATLIFVILTAVGITLTTSAQTHNGSCGEQVTWTLDTATGTLTISGTGEMKNFDPTDSNFSPWYIYRFSVKTVTIENGITSIGDYLFYQCSSLTDITIPNSVTSIGDGAFCQCSSLTSITIPNSVTSIGQKAFYQCSSLTSFTIPNSVASIGNWAFSDCTSFTSITIPSSVISIGKGAFEYCYKLVEIYNLSPLSIVKGSTDHGYVGNYALNVYTATSGESKLWIDDNGYIFYEDDTSCYLMGYTGNDPVLTLPQDCHGKTYEIYQYAFSDSVFLIGIVIPSSVTDIGDRAFWACSRLVEVYNLSPLSIVQGSTDYGYVSDYALNVYTAKIGTSNLWTDDNGYLFYEEGSTCYLMGYTGSETTLILPADCHGKAYGIYRNAFYRCHSLTSVTISDSVKSIGIAAFYGCTSLTDIALGNGVTSIGDSAFSSCSALTSITIPNNITTISSDMFSHCSSLTSVTLPFGIKSIESYAFYNCRNLQKVIYHGVQSQWNNVKKSGTWNSLTGKCKIEYHDYIVGVTTQPTCAQTGIRSYICSICGTFYTVQVAKIPHTWDQGAITVEPTHLMNGVKTYTCVCGETKTESISALPEHEWDEGKITTEPTHLTEGEKIFNCPCGETKTETVSKLPEHTYGDWEKHDGEQHKKSCECADVVYEAHTWNDGEVTTAPTTESEGVKTFTCTVCGESKTEAVEKLPVATTEATAATKEPENPSTTAPVGGSVSVTTAPDSPATTIGGTSANNSGNTSSSSGGCGSTVLGSMAIISLVSLAAVTLIKKKED